MLSRAARFMLAAVQAIIGWEWIVSGINKILSGSFPESLAGILKDGMAGNPNAWYVSFLQNMVLPNSLFFGYVIEWTELSIGVVLFAATILLLGRQKMRGEAQHEISIRFYAAASFVALLGAFLCVNFHFWMGHGLIPGLGATPSDEGIDLDALVPPFSLLIFCANLALIKGLRGETWYSSIYKDAVKGWHRFVGIEERNEQKNESVHVS